MRVEVSLDVSISLRLTATFLPSQLLHQFDRYRRGEVGEGEFLEQAVGGFVLQLAPDRVELFVSVVNLYYDAVCASSPSRCQ
jgi:hypothetical protein